MSELIFASRGFAPSCRRGLCQSEACEEERDRRFAKQSLVRLQKGGHLGQPMIVANGAANNDEIVAIQLRDLRELLDIDRGAALIQHAADISGHFSC